jgi:acetyl esterase/lipase
MTENDHTTLRVHRGVPFAERDQGSLALDVYEPDRSAPGPAVVLVHGGGFHFGRPGELSRYALDLAAAGYVAIDVQYRLAPGHQFPAALLDVKTAIEWARTDGESYGVDGSWIGAVGYSAGANLVALAAATAGESGFEPEEYPGVSSALDAVVGLAGVYDFAAMSDSDPENDDLHTSYLGVSPNEDRERAELASPAVQADASMPPTLLLHGRDDGTVPPAQSEQFASVLRPLTDVEFELLDSDHCFPLYGLEYETVSERLLAFFEAQADPR